jgi:glycosyltransferase involved in cell wall biosynthesis
MSAPARHSVRERAGSRLEPPFRILCFGYHPWSPLWKRNQSMMAALASRPRVAEVVFANPPVSAATPLDRLLDDLKSIRRHSWRGIWPHRPVPGLVVLTPVHWVPFRGRLGALARADRALLRGALLGRMGGRPFILVVNGVRRETLEIAELVAGEASYRVFDWSDDFAQFHKDPAARREIEELSVACVRSADLVLAVNQNLGARARDLGARVEVVINATGLRPLDRDRIPAGARELGARLGRPIIGYAGFINEHRVDEALVAELARRHPEWTILFIGVVQLDFDRRFRGYRNVVFHPPVPHRELAAYLSLFDVCLIPHLDNPHTAGNNPLKMYDYLTTGRPVIATRVAGLEGFEDVIEVAGDRERFIALVESALEKPDPPLAAAARRARAAEHTWEARAAQVEEILVRTLGGGREPGGGEASERPDMRR